MGTNLARVPLMFLHTHTHTPPLQPFTVNPPFSLSFICSEDGGGGDSVLKEMLFHKNGHSPFSRKYQG